MTLRLVFMGTPDFAVPSLNALIAAGHEVVCAYCQPPRRSGRGQKEKPQPVHAAAAAHGIPVRTPTSLKDVDTQAAFAALKADAAVVAAYGLLLPKPILDAPRLGCLNIHASLLPRWRGAAPIQRAILTGDRKTGITIMQMDEGLDTGPMLLQRALPIGQTTTAGELHDALARLGAPMIVEALAGLEAGTLKAKPQPAKRGVRYAPKTNKEEARIDWRLSASQLARTVRAFAPGAWFGHDGERIRVLGADAYGGRSDAAPGTVLDDALTIRCGKGFLKLRTVQRAGKGATDAAAFLRGYAIPKGTELPSPSPSHRAAMGPSVSPEGRGKR
ncbi:MAG TPA: methionyl-tRNA formyltransferase [Alphaproteobacteria bacterium]|nr:methionyl-tRNA formyltransferase [Alphaproteobacteria bacterium]